MPVAARRRAPAARRQGGSAAQPAPPHAQPSCAVPSSPAAGGPAHACASRGGARDVERSRRARDVSATVILSSSRSPTCALQRHRKAATRQLAPSRAKQRVPRHALYGRPGSPSSSKDSRERSTQLESAGGRGRGKEAQTPSLGTLCCSKSCRFRSWRVTPRDHSLSVSVAVSLSLCVSVCLSPCQASVLPRHVGLPPMPPSSGALSRHLCVRAGDARRKAIREMPGSMPEHEGCRPSEPATTCIAGNPLPGRRPAD